MEMPPADMAPQAPSGAGEFRLRDAVIIIAANVFGQLVGVAIYVALLAFDAGSFDGMMLQAQTDPWRNHLIVVSGSFGYLMMLPWIARLLRRRRITLAAIGFRRAGLKWFGIALGLFIALKGLTIWGMSYVDDSIVEAGYRTMEGMIGPGSLWSLASVLLVVVAAPLMEETAFRAALYQGLRRHMPGLVAAGISVVAFAAIHVQYAFAGGFAAVIMTAQVAVLGAILMFLYIRSGSLWPGIALHALNNGVTLTVLYMSLPA